MQNEQVESGLASVWTKSHKLLSSPLKSSSGGSEAGVSESEKKFISTNNIKCQKKYTKPRKLTYMSPQICCQW